MGATGQNAPGHYAGRGQQNTQAPAGRVYNPGSATSAALRQPPQQRSRADLEALRNKHRQPTGWNPAVPQPPDPNQAPYDQNPPVPSFGPAGPVNNGPISTTMPVAPTLTPTQGVAQPPGSIGQPAPPIQNNTPVPVMPSPEMPVQGEAQDPGSIGQPAGL